jgi:hypothetical protein
MCRRSRQPMTCHPAVKPRDDRCKDKSYNVKDRALILNNVIPRSLPSLNRSPGMTKKTAGSRLLVSRRLVAPERSVGGRAKEEADTNSS